MPLHRAKIGYPAVACLFVLLLALCCSSAFAEMPTSENVFDLPLPEGENEVLPIDLSIGHPLREDCFLSSTVYEDSSIRIVIEQYTLARDTKAFVARIKIADPSQLRTAPAYDFARDHEAVVLDMALRVNAAVAISGDYCSFQRQTKGGYLIRQGVTYLNMPIEHRDVLLIDANGNFHIVQDCNQSKMDVYKDQAIVNSFNFGPGLVVDGEKLNPSYDALFNASLERHQRSCIAQVKSGSLDYILAVCEGNFKIDQTTGLTMHEWADFIESLGVENAYNLDGGYSTALIFHGEKLNMPDNENHRKISDIIYFASSAQ